LRRRTVLAETRDEEHERYAQRENE